MKSDEMNGTARRHSLEIYHQQQHVLHEDPPVAAAPKGLLRSDTYHLKPSKRGICAIFNYSKFDKQAYAPEEVPNRSGTEIDVKSLNKVFRHCGFRVVVHENLSKPKLLDWVVSYAQDDQGDADAFFMILLTHGDERECGVLEVQTKTPFQTPTSTPTTRRSRSMISCNHSAPFPAPVFPSLANRRFSSSNPAAAIG